MSNPVWPHRRQPTRLPRPWDSPGKDTGVGCHFLLQCMKVKSESEVAQSYLTLRDPMDCSPPGSSVHGIFQARVLERGAIAFSRQIYYSKPKLRIFRKQNSILNTWPKTPQVLKLHSTWLCFHQKKKKDELNTVKMPSTQDISGCIKHNLQVRVHRPVGGKYLFIDHYNTVQKLV